MLPGVLQVQVSVHITQIYTLRDSVDYWARIQIQSSAVLQEWQKLDAEYVAHQFPPSTAHGVLQKLAAML